MKLIIHASYLPLIAPFISNEETRYYLCGFHVEPAPDGGVLIVATNGHVLGCFRDERGVYEPTIEADSPHDDIIRLSPELLRAAKARSAPFTRWLVVEGSGKSSTARMVDAGEKATPEEVCAGLPVVQVANVLIDGTFLDFRRVLPKVDATTIAGPNGYGCTPIAAFITAAGKGGAFQIFGGATGDPALVRISGRPDFFGVIMPCRTSGCAPEIPFAIDRKAPAEAPAEAPDEAPTFDSDGTCRLPDGYQIRHDVHGFYICDADEAEHEDAGNASAGFDGRDHYATIEDAATAFCQRQAA